VMIYAVRTRHVAFGLLVAVPKAYSSALSCKTRYWNKRMIARLTQISSSPVPDRTCEIRLFSVMRNEEQRVPFFLKYYAERGVDRFFVVDNNSTDSTALLLLSAPNAHVFRTTDSYSGSRYGIEWIEMLLASYGQSHWCVIADADELLTYPGCEHLSLPLLCQYFEAEQASALRCLLVDMYSDRPFDETKYVAGTDPLSVCPFFESDSILCLGPPEPQESGQWGHIGGMRRRLFNLKVRLDKVGLIKYSPTMQLRAGMHSVGNTRASEVRGALLHFKFLADFSKRVAGEALRLEHWNDAFEYKKYAEAIATGRHLCAYGPESRRLSQSRDLVDAGISICPDQFTRYLSTL
jgi:hypothetical protein